MQSPTLTELNLNDFDYQLPENLIARYPSAVRDQSRMLLLDKKTGEIKDKIFSEISEFIGPNDILVLNNARVLPVRLIGKKETGTADIEIFLLQPQNEVKTQWHALLKPAKRLPIGSKVIFNPSVLEITILEKQPDGIALVELTWDQTIALETILNTIGQMPLPPYMHRSAEAEDSERYQTVYAKINGAQAAPTAGLHFTPEVFNKIKAQGTLVVELTLLVGVGTFRPVLRNTIGEHKMSSEQYELTQDLADKITAVKQTGGKVFAVGTTVVKTLETIAHNNNGQLKAETGGSELFITPGFDFKIVDAMLTNFHLPKSTLLMLASAFCSHKIILDAYKHAIQNEYRFYSYGDCMLIS